MKQIKQYIDALHERRIGPKPSILDLALEKDREHLKKLFSEGKVQRVSDDYREQELELFAIKNPSLVYTPDFKDKFAKHYIALGKEKSLMEYGKWVYFPWNSTLVHILSENDFQTVRTARNKNLITEEEQAKFYNATVGIGGLSVGSSVAFALVLQGGAKHLKLADMDRLALSNTNRILTGVTDLGVLKVEMAARKIYEINPYATVELFPEGLNRENIDTFFDGLDIVVDELDNLAVKYLIREQAKKNKIAVVMAADNGDNAVVDVERYDLDTKTPFFHGRMGDISYEFLRDLDKFGIGRHIAKHIGPENITEKTFYSFLEMGKTIVSWPQLGGAALLNGSAVAYCIRKILNGQTIESNRGFISLDEGLDPLHHSPQSKATRAHITSEIKKVLKI